MTTQKSGIRSSPSIGQPLNGKMERFPHLIKAKAEYIQLPKSEPLHTECAHFLTCCQKRAEPKTNGFEGLQVVRLLQAAEESMENEGEFKQLSPTSSYFSHPTAQIDPSALVAEGTKIWHYSKVMKNARIGFSCNIGQNVVISPEVTLGNNVKVQNNVSIYTGVECEDDVF